MYGMVVRIKVGRCKCGKLYKKEFSKNKLIGACSQLIFRERVFFIAKPTATLIISGSDTSGGI
jgi:hypothetical protein